MPAWVAEPPAEGKDGIESWGAGPWGTDGWADPAGGTSGGGTSGPFSSDGAPKGPELSGPVTSSPARPRCCGQMMIRLPRRRSYGAVRHAVGSAPNCCCAQVSASFTFAVAGQNSTRRSSTAWLYPMISTFTSPSEFCGEIEQ